MTNRFPTRSVGCIRRRQTTYWDLDFNNESVWRVHFRHKLEHAFSEPGEFSSVRLLKRHPLLLDFTASWQGVYLTEPIADPPTILDQIDEVVTKATEGWSSADQYLNTLVDPQKLLAKGQGLVFEAPSTLCRKVLRVFKRANVRVSVLSHERRTVSARALIVGSSYVVAERFEYERMNESS